MVTVLDMLYPVLTLETLKMLPCTTLYAAPNSCDTRRFMMIDLDIECGRDVRHGMILAIAMSEMYQLKYDCNRGCTKQNAIVMLDQVYASQM